MIHDPYLAHNVPYLTLKTSLVNITNTTNETVVILSEPISDHFLVVPPNFSLITRIVITKLENIEHNSAK